MVKLAPQALYIVLLPLFKPLQPQVHGPLPLKLATVVPLAQRFGEPEFNVENAPPFAVPQAPGTEAEPTTTTASDVASETPALWQVMSKVYVPLPIPLLWVMASPLLICDPDQAFEASQESGLPVVVHESVVEPGEVRGPGGVAMRETVMPLLPQDWVLQVPSGLVPVQSESGTTPPVSLSMQAML